MLLTKRMFLFGFCMCYTQALLTTIARSSSGLMKAVNDKMTSDMHSVQYNIQCRSYAILADNYPRDIHAEVLRKNTGAEITSICIHGTKTEGSYYCRGNTVTLEWPLIAIIRAQKMQTLLVCWTCHRYV